MEFKDRAIYQLPNGRELVARVVSPNKFVLQNLSAAHLEEYELGVDGRLALQGKLTGWSVEDLVETGRFAQSDLTAALEETHREAGPVYAES